MADRTVSARLEIDIAKYQASLAAAERSTHKFADDLERTGRTAGDKFARDMDDAGKKAGEGFSRHGRPAGEQFVRDAQGRLRDARGKFVGEGDRLGNGFARGLRRGASRGGGIDLRGMVSGSQALGYVAAGAGIAVAALQGIPPVVGAIAGSLAAIPGIAAGATGSILTLAAAFNGIGSAIGDVFNPPATGGGGGGGGADQTASNQRRLESAQRSYNRAVRDEADAQRDVARARHDAAQELRDLQISLGRMALDEKDAALTVRESFKELQDLQRQAELAPGLVDPMELERAQLGYDQAKQSLLETTVQAGDLREDYAAAAKAGVQGSDQVQQALRRQQDAADAVIDAHNSILDAQDAIAAAAAGAAGGGAKAATAYDKLSKNAKKFIDEIIRLKPELVGLQHLAQDRVFAGLDKELAQTAKVALPFARTQVKMFGDTWNETFKQLFRLGRNPQFLAGLEDAFQVADRQMDKFNLRIPATGAAFSKLFTGSVPMIDMMGDRLVGWLDKFNTMIDRASQTGRLDEFFADAQVQAGALFDITEDLVTIFAKFVDLGDGSTFLVDMAEATDRFAHSTQAMDDIQQISDTAGEALRGIIDVLVILGDALRDSFADEGTQASVRAFFEVLGIGAEAVGDLLRAFSALPDSVQTMIVVGAAAAVLGSRVAGALGGITSIAGRAADRLGSLGPAGERAGRGLSAAGRAANVAAGAFIAWEAATALWDSMESDAANVDKLADALDHLGRTGESAGELKRIFGGGGLFGDTGLDQFAQDLRATDSAFSGFGKSVETWVPWAGKAMELTWGTSWTKATGDIKGMDQALAEMVSSGNQAGAQAAFDRLTQAAADQHISVEELRAKMPEYANAVANAGTASGTAAGGIGDVGTAADDATTQINDLKTAFDGLFGIEMDLDRATLDYKEGLATLKTELADGPRTLNENTAAGRDNVTGVLDQIDKIGRLRQARIDHGETIDVANGKYRNELTALRNTLVQMGFNKTQIDQLIGKYKGIPAKVNTAVNVSTSQATNAVREINAKIAAMKGKNIPITMSMVLDNTSISLGNLLRRWGGIDYKMAQGGALVKAHVATSPTVLFGERETRGEAYIPMDGDRTRSMSILSEAAGWYGQSVVPTSSLASSVAYSGPTTTAGPGINYGALAGAVASAVASAVPASSGDVVLQIDSVEIARAARAGQRDLDRRA